MAEDTNLVARLRREAAQCHPMFGTLYGEAADMLAEQAETIERLRAALERVLHYWQERYGMEFQKTDEALIDEVRRVQKALHSAAEPKPLPTESEKV